jgi:hypothetical protein
MKTPLSTSNLSNLYERYVGEGLISVIKPVFDRVEP